MCQGVLGVALCVLRLCLLGARVCVVFLPLARGGTLCAVCQWVLGVTLCVLCLCVLGVTLRVLRLCLLGARVGVVCILLARGGTLCAVYQRVLGVISSHRFLRNLWSHKRCSVTGCPQRQVKFWTCPLV